jgi:hypothetical protein
VVRLRIWLGWPVPNADSRRLTFASASGTGGYAGLIETIVGRLQAGLGTLADADDDADDNNGNKSKDYNVFDQTLARPMISAILHNRPTLLGVATYK